METNKNSGKQLPLREKSDQLKNKSAHIPNLFKTLTHREIELIGILKTGLSNQQAASVMLITYFTVNQHLKNIYKKLNINSKSGLLSLSFSKDLKKAPHKFIK